MWIVRLALSRPRMISVLAILIVILGVLSIVVTPTDVFPNVNIPVISVVWSYGGLSPKDMEERVVNQCERSLTTSVANIQHIESTKISGTSVIKIYLQPGTEISTAITQINSTCETAIRSMPPGITPPLILQFQASDVPVLEMSVDSPTMTPAEINDQASNFVRTPLVTVPGVQVSPPFGGVPRLVNVDLNPQSLYSYGLSPGDVTNALTAQNLLLPAGSARIGNVQYPVRMNNSTDTVNELNDLPIKVVNGATIYMHDVAKIHTGHGPQVSMVDVNGDPSVLLTIYKSGNASTLAVVNGVKAALPGITASLTQGLHLNVLLDQSIFVKASINSVVREGVIAACLTALMILLFLGSWRSTLIVFLSIPLSILTSIIILGLLGETLNTMTLGGMALAVGILVDDATVEIENTTRNLNLGLPLRKAILTSASQIALPALASTLSICIVFVPVAALTGAAQSLFLPMAMAVVFAMLASYLLSRTLVTTMMQALLRSEYPENAAMDNAGSNQGNVTPSQSPETPEEEVPETQSAPVTPARPNVLKRIHTWVDQRFETLRDHHTVLLTWALGHRKLVLLIFLLYVGASMIALPFVGEDFFPQVDSGEMRLHVRTPPGTRIEVAGRDFASVETTIRQIIPSDELSLIVDNIGQAGSLNAVYSTSGTIGSEDGEIDISLAQSHPSVWGIQQSLRDGLRKAYPNFTFYFQPADITSQILDFGMPAPIDIQVGGPIRNDAQDNALAIQIQKQVSGVQGVVDCYVYQVTNEPALNIDVNRANAMQVGLTQSDVASSVLDSLSSSFQTSPSFWLDPTTGVQYSVSAQTPLYRMSSIESILNVPVTPTSTGTISTQPAQLLTNLAQISHFTTDEVISHYNINPVYDVYASVQNRDLGSVSHDINSILAGYKKQTPTGSSITMQGQVATMNTSFLGLGYGLIFAVVLIYILLVVNFESWVDPFIIMMAAPAALCGVIWMLFITQTTFSVPALMGTIMCIGVATSNSILLITYANDARFEGKNAIEAALTAGHTRLRPVIMTATAMIVGVLPMALGWAEGGEQNAPLGRAVIGGLLVATVSTLTFVPVVYSVVQRKQPDPKPVMVEDIN